jgi:hypothetical protein
LQGRLFVARRLKRGNTKTISSAVFAQANSYARMASRNAR